MALARQLELYEKLSAVNASTNEVTLTRKSMQTIIEKNKKVFVMYMQKTIKLKVYLHNVLYVL